MELILARKCDAVARHGIPCIYCILRLIALHIFNRLLVSNVYGSQGQRKQQHRVLDDEIINSVQHAKLLTKYMLRSCENTEYHKSQDINCNTPGTTIHNCNSCPRSFKEDINLTLHVYWHTCQERKANARKKGQHVPAELEEEDQSDEEDSNSSDLPFRFKA